jgi:hypothetical protein
VINATTKGDETLIRNFLQLSLLAYERGHVKLENWNPDEAKEALNPSTSSNNNNQQPPLEKNTEMTASNQSLNLLAGNGSEGDSAARVLSRIEVLDAGTSRLLRTLTESTASSSKTTQATLDRLSETIDAVLKRLNHLETAQSEIIYRLHQSGAGSNTESGGAGVSEDSSSSAQHSRSASAQSYGFGGWMKPRLAIPLSTTSGGHEHDPVRRGNSSESVMSTETFDTVNTNNGGNTSRRGGMSGFLDKRSKRISTDIQGTLGGSSPILSVPPNIVGINGPAGGGAPPMSPQTPKLFSKLPQEIVNSGLPKAELMRLSVVYEFIETESDYVKDLGIMVNVSVRHSMLL